MSAEGYHAAVGAFFSNEVEALEELDRTNAIHAYIRRESLAALKRSFTPPGPLLEFGFGTGTEAIELARAGFRLVGVDPSEAMVNRAKEKADREGVAPLCDFRLGSTADAGSLLEEFGEESFAGAFATLGPLNCEPNLEGFSAQLARLLFPGAALVALVINRLCVWETALFLCKGDFRKAFRRAAREWAPLRDASSGAPIPVFTYSPRSFARRFEPHFEVADCFALPAVLPPPYADRVLARFGGLPKLLETADRRLARRWPVAFLGDHFEIVLRRTERT